VTLPIRHIAMLAGVLVLGILLGRFAVPRLELRSEITAIVSTSKKGCGFATSKTTFVLGQPWELIDGGIGLQCGERRQISKDAFLYCECD
jgi:hypothetical protein